MSLKICVPEFLPRAIISSLPCAPSLLVVSLFLCLFAVWAVLLSDLHDVRTSRIAARALDAFEMIFAVGFSAFTDDARASGVTAWAHRHPLRSEIKLAPKIDRASRIIFINSSCVDGNARSPSIGGFALHPTHRAADSIIERSRFTSVSSLSTSSQSSHIHIVYQTPSGALPFLRSSNPSRLFCTS